MLKWGRRGNAPEFNSVKIMYMSYAHIHNFYVQDRYFVTIFHIYKKIRGTAIRTQP